MTVKVLYASGDSTTTRFNGTIADARQYFRIGTSVNVGIGPEDNMQTIIAVWEVTQ